MKRFTVKDLIENKGKDLSLSVISNPNTIDKLITNHNINRPQLALSGYYHRFPADRIQLLGETEIVYLNSLSSDVLYDRLREIMMHNIPCFIVSKGLSVPSQMEFLANELNVGLLISRFSTEKLFWELTKYLRDLFSQSLTIHSTLVEVYGIGILLTGKSGVGKSECALELIERGHTIVSDDISLIKSDDTRLYGFSPKKFECFMEVRGVGVIDVERMFGIQAVRKKTTVDVQVELMLLNENVDYERIGLGNETTEMLGINIPVVNIPVSPGKNVAVIIEVIALNQILKRNGYDAAKNLQKRLSDEIMQKRNEK